VGADIVKALDNVRNIKDIFVGMHQNSQRSFKKIYDAAVKLATSMNVLVDKPRLAKRSVFRAAATTDDESVILYYCINMYIPLLDGLCTHLNDHFGPTQEKALSLMGLIPAYISGGVEILQLANDLYSVLHSSEHKISSELTIRKHKWQQQPKHAAQIQTATASLQEVCKTETLPNIEVLLQILATLPVTTAEPERVFSRVERTLQ